MDAGIGKTAALGEKHDEFIFVLLPNRMPRIALSNQPDNLNSH